MTLANIRTDFLHWVAAGLGVIVALSACGGGDSSIDPAPVLPRLPLAADLHSTYLTFDAARDRIYASVLTIGGNRLVAINPPNGSQTVLIDAQADVPRQVHGPGTPAQIALSSAGTYLFIAAASGELIRYDFATQSIDRRLEPPLGVGPNLRVSRVVASPVDDERAFALLEPPDASSNPQAAAVATLVGSAWSPNVLDLGDRLPPPRVFEYSDDYGIWIRPDGTELIYGPGSASKRIRIDMGLPVSVTSINLPVNTTYSFTPPQFTSQGVLWNAQLFDPVTFAPGHIVPGAIACVLLQTAHRVACIGPLELNGNRLFVYDLERRAELAGWYDPFGATGRLLAAGPGRVAVQYTVHTRFYSVSFPYSMYIHPALN